MFATLQVPRCSIIIEGKEYLKLSIKRKNGVNLRFPKFGRQKKAKKNKIELENDAPVS